MKRLAIAVSLCAAAGVLAPIVNAESGPRVGYEIVKATEDRVWRLDRATGEIAVCTLVEERLMCTSSATAITPPEMSYEALQAQRAEEARIASERQAQRQQRQQAIVEAMLGAFKTIALNAPEAQ